MQTLILAVANSERPDRVQLVLVLAGGVQSSSTTTTTTTMDKQSLFATTRITAPTTDYYAQKLGDFKVVEFLEESGRGPCLNFGAAQADGAIYAFCHSDTRLPHHWDTKLIQTLYHHNTQGGGGARRTNSCAYGFGIDTSKEGLKGGPCPPGIGAVQTTANLRCRLWSLPYGDQCLSLRADDFRYLGGFPHQCFMEDYELIALLRKRVRLLPTFRRAIVAATTTTTVSNKAAEPSQIEDETLTIVPGAPALCSPRRWQRFGVVYVTYTNSKLVNLYAGGMTPDELYGLYYGHALAVVAPMSPWEIELDKLLI